MTRDYRLCFIGDSFVNGTGDRACLGWVGRVTAATAAAGYNLTLYNLGIRGETSLQIAHRWSREVLARLPQDVDGRLVFSFGVNDTRLQGDGHWRVPLADAINGARQLLSTAHSRYPTLMIGPPPIADADANHRIATLSRNFVTVCREVGVPYLELFPALGENPRWRQAVAAGDGAHPDGDGYAEWANQVLYWSAWRQWFPALAP